SDGEAGGRLAPKAANPPPLAKPAIRRQTPKVRAVCIKVHVRIRAGGARQLASLPRPSIGSLASIRATGSCWAIPDPGCVKTSQAQSPRERLSQIARNLRRPDIVVARIAVRRDSCSINFQRRSVFTQPIPKGDIAEQTPLFDH